MQGIKLSKSWRRKDISINICEGLFDGIYKFDFTGRQENYFQLTDPDWQRKILRQKSILTIACNSDSLNELLLQPNVVLVFVF